MPEPFALLLALLGLLGAGLLGYGLYCWGHTRGYVAGAQAARRLRP